MNTLEEKLRRILLEILALFPLPLLSLIHDYWRLPYDSLPSHTWSPSSTSSSFPFFSFTKKPSSQLSGLTVDPQQQLLYLCDFLSHTLLSASLSTTTSPTKGGEMMIKEEKSPSTSSTFLPLQYPVAVDIEKETGDLYIVDQNNVSIYNTRSKTKKSSWELTMPMKNCFYDRGMKVDGGILYLTICSYNEIFVFNGSTGTLLLQFGSSQEGKGKGEFNQPCGLTTDLTNLYVTDCANHRLQVLDKHSGQYICEWGSEGTKGESKFYFPSTIYRAERTQKAKGQDQDTAESESWIYVGDRMSVQIFTTCGVFLQRLECPDGLVTGLCADEDHLYVSDQKRIRAFRHTEQRALAF